MEGRDRCHARWLVQIWLEDSSFVYSVSLHIIAYVMLGNLKLVPLTEIDYEVVKTELMTLLVLL